MRQSNKQLNNDIKLRIAFPKSSEDHRLQLIDINGSIFSILFSPLESDGPIRLNCSEWSLILLAPIKSRSNILVSAINIISLGEISSEKGNVNVHASNRLVKFSDLFKPKEKLCEMGERGEYQIDNDPGSVLYFYRLFEGIIKDARNKSPESLERAKQQVVEGICSLADKINKQKGALDLKKVLSIWNISRLKK